jgi:hydrogenase maturation factor
MKLYGKRFFRRAMDQEAQYRRETRDGIVWEHLPDQRLARVKIQGSNELVVAWYPENWQKTPVFLKPGNAVRIAHVGGVRNRVEIVGHGLAIPTPVAGGVLPDMGAGANYWVSGGGLLSTEVSSLRVRILPGIVRIDGVNYDLSFDPVMGSDMEMGDGVVIGSGIGIEQIDDPPPFAYPWYGETAQYRYDAFVVGADGVVDYLKGTATIGTSGPPSYNPTPPVKPAIPGGHVIIGDYILVYSGMTAIEQSDVGRIFATPGPYRLLMTIGDPEMVMNPPDHRIPPPYYPIPHPTNTPISLMMIDQYGNPSPRPGGGSYLFVLTFIGFMAGMGVVGRRSITGATLDPTEDTIYGEGGYVYTFNFERMNAKSGYSYDPADPESAGYVDDLSPALNGYVDYGGQRYNASGRVVCLDENGTPMPPYLVL